MAKQNVTNFLGSNTEQLSKNPFLPCFLHILRKKKCYLHLSGTGKNKDIYYKDMQRTEENLNTLETYTELDMKQSIKPHQGIDAIDSDLLIRNTLVKEINQIFLLYNTHKKG